MSNVSEPCYGNSGRSKVISLYQPVESVKLILNQMPAQNDILEEINTTLPNLDSIVSQMSKESMSSELIDKQQVEQISPLEV